MEPFLIVRNRFAKARFVPENPPTECTRRGGVRPVFPFSGVSGKISLFSGGVLVASVVGHSSCAEACTLYRAIGHFKVGIKLFLRSLGFHDFDEAFHFLHSAL